MLINMLKGARLKLSNPAVVVEIEGTARAITGGMALAVKARYAPPLLAFFQYIPPVSPVNIPANARDPVSVIYLKTVSVKL
jgi:hypothetical protein